MDRKTINAPKKYPLQELRLNVPNSADDDDQNDYDDRISYEGTYNDGLCDNAAAKENYLPSPASSSPPRDFDLNIRPQYAPILDEADFQDEDLEAQSSSLASSLSIESNHDYPTSPVVLTTTNSARVIRCPKCEKPMRTYYCVKCIQRGDFVTVENLKPESFKLNLHAKSFAVDLLPDKTAKEDYGNSGSGPNDEQCKALEEQIRQEREQVRLRTLTRKTEALSQLYNGQKQKLEQTKVSIQNTKLELEQERKSFKSKEAKIDLIKKYITSRESSIKKRHCNEVRLLDDIRDYARQRVFQLAADVFPIEEFNPGDHNSSYVNMETSPLLTFSDGSHHQIDQQTAYSIVEPWLPSDGDYGAYSWWVNDNPDRIHTSTSDISERNPAFRIGAGLTYTTQLVKNLASYLDVILPAKMELATFSRGLMSDAQFSYNVGKLNANIIHLCVSQGVDTSLIQPRRTLKNLLLLFNLNVCDLGRKSVINLDNEEMAARIEEQLAGDLSLIQEDICELGKFCDNYNDGLNNGDDETSDSEWEISDTINPIDAQLAATAEQSAIQQNSYIARLPLRLFTSFWSGGGASV